MSVDSQHKSIASILRLEAASGSLCCLLHASFLVYSLFNPEDGGDVLPKTVITGLRGITYRKTKILHTFAITFCTKF
jgi:hypothetical protein